VVVLCNGKGVIHIKKVLLCVRPPRYVTSHLGQLSLLSSEGVEISIHQSLVMLSGWVVKAGWLIPFVDKRMDDR